LHDPQAGWTAVEMAAWDLYARQAGVPLSRVLGGTRDRIASGVSIGIQDSLAELAATYPPIPAAENGAEVFLQLWETDDPAFWQAFRAGATSLPTQMERHFDEALPVLGSSAQRIDRVTALAPDGVAAGNEVVRVRLGESGSRHRREQQCIFGHRADRWRHDYRRFVHHL
jgi:L-alanine-DL-glutamate epimerase-like enolase superfamily enzyme